MICKIQPPNPSAGAAVRYNEKKMYEDERELSEKIEEATKKGEKEREAIKDFENGRILATRGVPEGEDFLQVIEKRTLEAQRKPHRGPRMQNYSFHMSVNPAEDDAPLSDEQVVAFIDELMQELGYGNQPYRIYKHTDIERTHYHVVSTRADENGNKINDSFEKYRLRSAMHRLEEKYGFSVVPSKYERIKKKEQERKKAAATTDSKGNTPQKPEIQPEKPARKEKNVREAGRVPRFNKRDTEPFLDQIRRCVGDSLGWSFTTFEQWQHMLLQRHNVLVLRQTDRNGAEYLMYFGTDRHGKPVMQPVTDRDLGASYFEDAKRKCSETKMSEKAAQKKRLEGIVRGAAVLADSWEKFNDLLERKGIGLAVAFNTEGNPFGLTWTDRGTKCIWKGSETGVDLKWLTDICSAKGWIPAKTATQTAIERRTRNTAGAASIATGRASARQTPESRGRGKAGGKAKEPALRGLGPVHGPSGGGSTYNPDDDYDKLIRNRDDENNRRQGAGI